ncbi:hypothetical protein ABIE12_003540, partial [Serratia sp. 509]
PCSFGGKEVISATSTASLSKVNQSMLMKNHDAFS